MRVPRFALLTVGAALFVAACETGPNAPDQEAFTPGPALLVGDVVPQPDPTNQSAFVAAVAERYIICKTGPDATFDVTVDGNPAGRFSVADGECKIVFEEGGDSNDITSMEIVPVGVQLDDVQVTQLLCGKANALCGGAIQINGPTSVTDPAGGVVGGTAGGTNPNGFSGVVAHYFNSLIPPPPPGGGEGCTPGYWKNHAGADSFSKGGQKKPSSWEGYDPTDSYDAVFGVTSGFGGTLVEAAAQGGGGEKALGRHAVAALLNAASSGVSFDLSEQDVIDLVQAAYASGDFDGAKNALVILNEQGCPL